MKFNDFKRLIDSNTLLPKEISTDVCLFFYKEWIKLTTDEGDCFDGFRSSANSLMLTGATGTGKTFTVEKFAEILHLPFYIINCPELSPTGYKGSNLDVAMEGIEKAIHKYVAKTNDGKVRAVVLFDEFDKITSSARDDSFKSSNIQYEFLSYITKGHIIPVFAGSFSSKYDQVVTKRSIGFGSTPLNVQPKSSEIEDFQDEAKQLGVIPELVGRISCFKRMPDITEEYLHAILHYPNNQKLIEANKILNYAIGESFNLTEREKRAIIKRALKMKLGVRGLHTVIEEKVNEKILGGNND